MRSANGQLSAVLLLLLLSTLLDMTLSAENLKGQWPTEDDYDGENPGKIIGLVIAVIALIALAIAIMFYMYMLWYTYCRFAFLNSPTKPETAA